MASGTILVDPGGSHFSSLFTHFDNSEQITLLLEAQLSQTFNVDASGGALLDFEIGPVDWEEVVEGLLVDFQHGAGEHKFAVLFALIDVGKDWLDGSWDDALVVAISEFAKHGVGFAWARLPIGEDGAIVAIEDVLDCIAAYGIVDLVLLLLGREDPIEGVDDILL